MPCAFCSELVFVFVNAQFTGRHFHLVSSRERFCVNLQSFVPQIVAQWLF